MSRSILMTNRRGLLAGALSVSIARAEDLSRQASQTPTETVADAGN